MNTTAFRCFNLRIKPTKRHEPPRPFTCTAARPVITPHFDAEGRLNFWFVLASENLRSLVRAYLLRTYPELNYVNHWRDTHGFGLHLTIAEWVRPGQIYTQW